ncbi:uncharacterized protein CG7065-like [Frankliniella occidentalis]|uniref:Uncharacterized protein CG7065-like n=1 Tax=Frankliniella occidentalis TaxID=133901 RepID=A0A6J1T0M1_FRAOC|nr:uncharacterized protein CG7065-like [Frankliniella occidentalis]
MEGYFSIGGSHHVFDDFDIEGKKSFDDIERKQNNVKPKPVPRNQQSQEEADKSRLLEQKVDLDNGAVGYVFSVSGTGYNAQWKCHVCDMTFMGIKNLLFHERSMNHSSLMQVSKHHASQFMRMEKKDGEPAPPGVDEDDEESEPPVLTHIQSTLDDHKSSPLIGLEYVVELNDDYEKESSYVCMLCDKKGDPRTVMAHLVSYNHRSKYLERHFPITFNAINSLPKTVGARRGLAEIVTRISNEMEEKLGRLHPVPTDGRHFEENRFDLMCSINKGKHFIETPDNTFVHLVDRELLTAAAMKNEEIPVRDANPPSKASDKNKGGTEDDDEIEFQGAFVKGTRVPLTRQLRIRKISIEGEDKTTEGVNKNQVKPTGPAAAAAASKKEDDACSLSSISSASSARDEFGRVLRSSLSRSRSRSGSRSRRRRKSRSRSRSRGRYRRSRSRSRSRSRRSRSPYGRGRRARSPRSRPGDSKRDDRKRSKDRADDLSQEKAKWEKFREELAIVEKEMLETLSQHEKNPEKHPKYPEEWKLFWNKRYKELQASGKDPNKHDFKPEWIEFWNRRMRELHEQDFMKKKEELREKLNLPVDEPKPHFNRRKKFVRDVDGVPVTDSSGKVRSRSPSPWEEGMAPGAFAARERDRERERERDRERDRDFPPAYRQLRTEWRERSPPPLPRIITILRMLTALEQQLGSLGPRVNSVLSEAIAMEKTTNSDAMLRDGEVVVLLETVREKFRGQLLAGIVERNHVNATRNAIGGIGELLYRAPAILERLPPPRVPSPARPPVRLVEPPAVVHVPAPAVPRVAPKPTPAPAPAPPAPAPDPVSVPGVGAVDKAAIAREIAAALVLQGKTDVSEAELEQLVAAVVGMAQAKAETEQAQALALAQAQAQAQAQEAPKAPPPPPVTEPAPAAKADPPAAKPAQPTTQAPPEVTGLQLLQSAYDADEAKGSQQMKERQGTPVDGADAVKAPANKAPAVPVGSNPPPAPSAALTTAQAIDAYVDELTETDLRLLLQSFKDLPLDEQHGLIRYLKKLEATDPVRVERLRKYVNLGPGSNPKSAAKTTIPIEKLQALAKVGQSGRLSPFSSRQQSRNPAQSETQRPAMHLDTDSDDDYSFDDVCKAAKAKVSEHEAAVAVIKEKEEAKKRREQEEINKKIEEEKAKAQQALKAIEDREREQQRIVKEKERIEREAALKVGAANWTALSSSSTGSHQLSIPPPPVPPMQSMYGSGYGELANSVAGQMGATMGMGNFNGGAGFFGSNSYNQYQETGYDQQGAFYQGQQNSNAMYQGQSGSFNSQGFGGYGNNAMFQQPPPQHQGQQGYPVAPYSNQYHY